MEELEKNETSTQAEENTVSLASAQALADALAKIEAYTPTTWVDNSSPDIDAEHLNKPEQAIKRVTDALNSAVDVIKGLQSQVTKNAGDISTVNNNLSKKLFVNIGDTSNANHSKIDQIADFYGATWVKNDYNSTFGGRWCFIDSTVVDPYGPYAVQRIMSCENAAILATRYCTKGTWGAWNVGVTKSDLTALTDIILTPANSYSFSADFTYGYKRAGWVEIQFSLASAFDLNKNRILSIPNGCLPKKQVWFPVYESSGGNVIARGYIVGSNIYINGSNSINGKTKLFGHVVYMSES